MGKHAAAPRHATKRRHARPAPSIRAHRQPTATRRVVVSAAGAALVAGSVATVVVQPSSAGAPVPAALPRPLPTASPAELPDPITQPLDGSAVRRLPAASVGRARHETPLHLTGANPGTIPLRALDAYEAAARGEARRDPACGFTWPVLAGIGYIESGHGRSGGSADPRWNGIAKPRILGPVLDGSNGFAAVPDTDGGRLDGDRVWDRAVGPMQFIPSTWAQFGIDGDNDGVADPEDIYDAAASAANYLCATGADLSTPDGLVEAVYSYNHDDGYVRAVLEVTKTYDQRLSGTLVAALSRLPAPAGVKPPAKHHVRARVVTARPRRTPTFDYTPPAAPTSAATPTSAGSASPTATPSETSSPGPDEVSPSPSATP